MIPVEWQPHHRPDDGELVGYLVPDGALAVPTTLIGTALGEAAEPAVAAAALDARGLSALDGVWWCRVPDTLPSGRISADTPGDGWRWRRVVIVESSPTECRVRPAMPWPEELRSDAVLTPPVGDRLRSSAPE